jgi:hypothetical protein
MWCGIECRRLQQFQVHAESDKVSAKLCFCSARSQGFSLPTSVSALCHFFPITVYDRIKAPPE